MAIFMFSLAGIPPLFGFWPKFLVFNAAVEADLTWLAAVAIATSVIGAFYYIMIVKLMYFDEPAPAFAETREPVGAGLIFASAAVRVAARLSRHRRRSTARPWPRPARSFSPDSSSAPSTRLASRSRWRVAIS